MVARKNDEVLSFSIRLFVFVDLFLEVVFGEEMKEVLIWKR